MTERYLIVGLGNPGREYRFNRHNVGFILLDRFAARYAFGGFTRKQGQALISSGMVGEAAVILAKPQTYMNRSGEAVAGLVRFYNLPLANLLVCLDDIDLPLGTLRLRPGGGAAGHNGMRSIIDCLGTEDFARLRVGIGRPPGVKTAAAYVLRDFDDDELEIIDLAVERAVEAIVSFVRDGVALTMSRFNSPPAAGKT